MQDLREGFQIIDENRARGFFAGPRDPALIASAELALGGKFPPTYREFLERLGAGNFGAFEFYGVTTEDFRNAKIPNGIWLTLKQRESCNLPHNLLLIADTGDGAYYCLALHDGQETPVMVCHVGMPGAQQPTEEVAKDFGEFFYNQIRDQL